MTDNSAALRRARRRDGQAKRRQALAAIETMAEAGEPISFPSVARRAGVSVSLLYADNDLLTRIAGARDRQRQAARSAPRGFPLARLSPRQACAPTLPTPGNRIAGSPGNSRSCATGLPATWPPPPTSPGVVPPVPSWTGWRSGPPTLRPTTPGYTSRSAGLKPTPGNCRKTSRPPGT